MQCSSTHHGKKMGRGEKGEKEGLKRKGKEGRRSKRQKEFDTRREAGKERGWKYGENPQKGEGK